MSPLMPIPPPGSSPLSLDNWIKAVSAINAEANAAAQAPWTPPPRWDDSKTRDGLDYGAMTLHEAIHMSRNKMAVGFLPHTVIGPIQIEWFRHRVGAPVAAANGVAVWSLNNEKHLGERSNWDDDFYVWETMDPWNRAFFEGLHWSPMEPMSPMEVLASVAD